MRIGIDVRDISTSQSEFTNEFIKHFCSKNENNELNIYSNEDIEGVRIIKSKRFNSFFGEQILFFKKLLKDKNDLIITFNDTFPILYKKKFIQVVVSLERLLYPDLKNAKTLRKHAYQNILKRNLKNASKIICFDEKTKKDINEKLNIDEGKIEVIEAFFYKIEKQDNGIIPGLDIKQKHCMKKDYLIYDSEVGTNKNIKRLLDAISKTDINLVLIGNKISCDIETRELVMRLGLRDKIIFAGVPEKSEIGLYYKQSLGVIFPSIYSSFPFSLSKAINFGKVILSSDIDEIKNILGNKAIYFSPISTLEIIKSINKLIKIGKKEINYDNILKRYSCENFINNLSNACQI